MSQSVDNLRSPKNSGLQAKKELFLFPNPNSQRIGSPVLRKKQPDDEDENSDVEKYLNQGLNPSISESIDIPKQLLRSTPRPPPTNILANPQLGKIIPVINILEKIA